MNKLTHFLVVVFGATIIILGLALVAVRPTTEASTTSKPFPLRQFYLTAGPNALGFNGAQVLSACATGYHTASLWEILDVSNLRYETVLGLTVGDSGSGPPSGFPAWVRTGAVSVAGGNAGVANCIGWTTADSNASGTFVVLNGFWASGSSMSSVNPWIGATQSCNNVAGVWCVQD